MFQHQILHTSLISLSTSSHYHITSPGFSAISLALAQEAAIDWQRIAPLQKLATWSAGGKYREQEPSFCNLWCPTFQKIRRRVNTLNIS